MSDGGAAPWGAGVPGVVGTGDPGPRGNVFDGKGGGDEGVLGQV